MKTIINTLLTTIILVFVVMACQPKKTEQADSEIQQKVNAYASFELKADLNRLSANEKKMIPILIEAADIMNEIFWKQTYGDKESLMAQITDPSVKQFVEINYGPWERLAANQSFVEGIGPKFPGAQFYPADMTKEEFEESDAPDKTSLYTMIRRGKDGKLISIPYHTFFNEEVTRAADLIRQAAELAEDEGLKRYLTLRADALLNDDYYPSDIAWMEMKTNNIDFVIGPIENYEDALFGYKAAYEGFVLVKDQEWSSKLARFAALLPTLQLTLPVPDEYKKEVPGSDSDLGVYEALYYAGDCNSGSKTIAINLPNDERVQIEKGSRKLQLKNSMRAKFEKILLPISAELIHPDQQKHIGFDAFFENVMFHEVSHGLGIKNTITGMGSVRKALSEQYSPIEEAKADILGLYLVSQLAEMGELGEKDLMDN
ncbi:MAG: Zn-dependent hydrolase, partial [Bacteroidales bacterium]